MMHRVCMLWHQMLPEHLVTADVVVDISVKLDDKPDKDGTQDILHASKSVNSTWNDEYHLTMVLDRMITHRTKTLTLVNLAVNRSREFESRANTATEVLLAKGIRIPVMILRNCASRRAELIKNTATSGNYECRNFSKLMAVCERLLIVHHNFSFAEAFFRRPILCSGEPQMIPEPEKAFVRPYCPDKPGRVVRVNRLLLRSADSVDQHVRLLLLAANNACLLVSQCVIDKITYVHQRWRQTLAYPEDWVAVRNFLNLFSGFLSDGTPQRWDALDLRELDISALSKITLAAIDEIFTGADAD
ncbi:uncharacterized protein LOC129593230 [Paramacrobiotus metropolitanus]|uniref:uncharacterized protein LOC129593230 n=1 Tax=Paramacrobiotus metropolitanus TaxID=2943436 RepID=UPI002445650F|nr:uncharacterized protein LOC129593230 [Paramacrobiotus metropolitanus]